MIGLCSKLYCTERFHTEEGCGEVKFGIKSVNKGQFENPMTRYEQVLTSVESFRACNSGIRSKDQMMAMYKQYKNALTYFYPKCKVLGTFLSFRLGLPSGLHYISLMQQKLGSGSDNSECMHRIKVCSMPEIFLNKICLMQNLNLSFFPHNVKFFLHNVQLKKCCFFLFTKFNLNFSCTTFKF